MASSMELGASMKVILKLSPVRRLLLKAALLVIALHSAQGTLPALADDDDRAPVKYTLEVASSRIALGESPGLRLIATDVSSAPIDHVIDVGPGYTIKVHGPAQVPFWFFQSHISEPRLLRLRPGVPMYVFGTTASFVHPDEEVFDKKGSYAVQYCDSWLIDGDRRKICSNEITIHVDDPK